MELRSLTSPLDSKDSGKWARNYGRKQTAYSSEISIEGFASRIAGDKIFTWVYRKGAKPFQTTIEIVSVEKHFYGNPGGLSADEEITKLETGYAYLSDEIRNANDSTEITSLKLPVIDSRRASDLSTRQGLLGLLFLQSLCCRMKQLFLR